MIQRRMFLAFFISIILVPLSGCIGGDEKEGPTGPVVVTNKGDGVNPDVKITLEPTMFEATGTMERKKHVTPSLLPAPVGKDTVTYKFLWNFEKLLPLGTDSNKGEVFYQLWAGSLKDNGEVQYVAQAETYSGFNSTVQGNTKWGQSHGKVTHYLLSMEAKKDAIIEFPLVEIPAMEAEKEGTWTNETMQPFAKAYGEVKLEKPTNGKLNMTVKVFDLPKTKNGYDAFLETATGTIFLGHLGLVPSLGAVGVVKEIEESKLKGWSVFVTYEPETQDEVPSYLTVLSSKFKAS